MQLQISCPEPHRTTPAGISDRPKLATSSDASGRAILLQPNRFRVGPWRLDRTACLLLAMGLGLYAQTNTGSIRGTVTDATQGIIPEVAVTLVDTTRGIERATRSSETGEFLFSYVDPGRYTVSFEAENFAPLTVDDLEVRVGETVTVSPVLELGATATEVVVSADQMQTGIEPERVQQADHIDSVRIQNLPVNRRDYLDLALLTPGVVDTNYIANATDRRILVTPTSGLGIGGMNGRGNTFMVDGLDNQYNSGAVRSSISQEAVREFQVNRNSFSTELGGAPGGAVNIVTKSGTNEVHGTLFGVVRNRRFQARNYFDPGKSAYTRAQSGSSIGGPVSRNRTFYHAAYERLDRNESQIVPLLDDSSFLYSLPPLQQRLADVLGQTAPPALLPLVGELSAALVPANTPGVVDLFEQNSGVFPFSEGRQQLIGRLDHQLRDGHNVFFRANMTRLDGENRNFGALVARSRGSAQGTRDIAVAIGDTFVISPSWVSETRIGAGYHDYGTYPTDPHGPSIDIGGFGHFGRDLLLPARVLERVFQVRQNFMRLSGRQTIKFGVDFNPTRDRIRVETFLGGRFIFGEAVPLSTVIDQAAGSPLSLLIKSSLGAAGLPELAGAVDRPITAIQAFALGLPTVYQQGFGSPFWLGWSNRMNFFVEDSIRVTPDFLLTLGLRHEVELKTRFPRDLNNFGPRGGFAWSPGAKTVIRGGFGIYYSRIDGQITYVNDLLGTAPQINQMFIPLTGAPGVVSSLTGEPVTSAQVFGSVRQRGILGQRGIVREDLESIGIEPGPGYPLRIGFRVVDDVVNPYSTQSSFEIQRQLGGYLLSAAYNFNRGVHLMRPLDLNVFQAGTREDGRPVAGFLDPLIFQDNAYGSWGRSFYHALIVQLKKRFSRGFTLTAHHTWSKTIDENTDYNSSYEPHIPWDARNELALSHFHRGHRFVANAVAQTPWKAARGQGFGKNLVSDFTLSGIMVARSFAPFNLNTGFDSFGDRHTDTHRPWGLGRNVGIGPAFFGVDLRLTRSFPLSERVSLSVVTEVFNVLNKTNFKQVNGVVGDVSIEDLPDRLVGHRGSVTEPLAFTSTFDPRQFQFSLRLAF